MKTYGLCFEPDALCQQEWLNHPLSYYRAKVRMAEKTRNGQTPPMKNGEAEKQRSPRTGSRGHSEASFHDRGQAVCELSLL